jgi:hypothetical protein
MVNINDPLVEKLLNVLEGEPECAAIAAAHRFNCVVGTFCDPRSNDPVTFSVLSVQAPQAVRISPCSPE